MEATTEIPLVGGVADGGRVIVDLDVHGRPPLTHHHLVDGTLVGAEIYELESTPGGEPPWRYQWRGPAS